MKQLIAILLLTLTALCSSHADARGRRGHYSSDSQPAVETATTAEGVAPEATDALDELNAARAKRGLPAYEKDDGLTEAAKAAASYRAARLISGHTSNDFAYVKSGSATAAGCAAWPPSMGWGSCCAYEHWRRGGAAWAMGRDGRRYMHLFVR